MVKKQHVDQAARINERKRETMKFHETAERSQFHRPFVNAGAPTHGVMGGEDMKNANNEHVKKEDVCGYSYKGYNPLAWKY